MQEIWKNVWGFLASGGWWTVVCVISVGGLMVGMFVLSLKPRKEREVPAEEGLPYRQRDDFLTEAEFAFYVALKTYLGERAVICPKVNLADLFFPVAEGDVRQKWLNRINRKHVDFLLCDPDTMQPLCGVELDDSSHEEEDRIARDIFVDEVYEAAGLILVHVPLQGGYSIEEMGEFFAPVMEFVWQETEAQGERMELGEFTIPHCPKCGALMVLRVYAAGEKKGYRYYGCPNFPQCRTVVDFVSGEIGKM